jgi:hypothetical protein
MSAAIRVTALPSFAERFLQQVDPMLVLFGLLGFAMLLAYAFQPLPGGDVRLERWVSAVRSMFKRHTSGGIVDPGLPILRPDLPGEFHVKRPRPPVLVLIGDTWPNCPKCGAWLVTKHTMEDHGLVSVVKCTVCPYVDPNHPMVAAIQANIRQSNEPTGGNTP